MYRIALYTYNIGGSNDPGYITVKYNGSTPLLTIGADPLGCLSESSRYVVGVNGNALGLSTELNPATFSIAQTLPLLSDLGETWLK